MTPSCGSAEVASAVTVFVGDDVTDEDAFAVLGATDVTVKVGAADSAARHRLHDTGAVAEWLRRLADDSAARPGATRQPRSPADRSGSERAVWPAGGMRLIAVHGT